MRSTAYHLHTARYGTSASQEGDLYLPEVQRPPVVCLLHGGFWRMPYGREPFAAVALDLAGRGYAVWNLGYRRLGEAGGGWPGTLEDAAAGLDHLVSLAQEGFDLDLDRLVVAGHSAGGQLALWLGARSAGARPRAVAGLAPALDLRALWERGLGNQAAGAFLGGSPAQHPDRYAAASPRERLPLGVPQLILHGVQDEDLPLAITQEYAEAARNAGDAIEFAPLAGMRHMDPLDPRSEAHTVLCRWLERILEDPEGAHP